MPKLTDEQGEQAKKALQERLVTAIEESPRGLTNGEIRKCILKTCIDIGLIKKPKALNVVEVIENDIRYSKLLNERR